MTKRFAICFLIAFSSALAQTVKHDSASHSVTPVDIIDGSKTSELIPDLTAWRLWLLSVTAEDTSKPQLSQARRQAFLRIAGIPESEIPVAEQVIVTFRTEYARLMENYNRRLNAGENPSLSEFRAQRDALVQAIQTSLSSKLEITRAGKLKDYIHQEKSRMKVAKEVQ